MGEDTSLKKIKKARDSNYIGLGIPRKGHEDDEAEDAA